MENNYYLDELPEEIFAIQQHLGSIDDQLDDVVRQLNKNEEDSLIVKEIRKLTHQNTIIAINNAFAQLYQIHLQTEQYGSHIQSRIERDSTNSLGYLIKHSYEAGIISKQEALQYINQHKDFREVKNNHSYCYVKMDKALIKFLNECKTSD